MAGAEAVAAVEVRVKAWAGSKGAAVWVPAASASARTAGTKRLIKEGCPVTSKNAPNAAPP